MNRNARVTEIDEDYSEMRLPTRNLALIRQSEKTSC